MQFKNTVSQIIRSFYLSCTQNKLNCLGMLLYLIFDYGIQKQILDGIFPVQFMFIVLFLKSPVRSLLSCSIKNDAMSFMKQSYIKDIASSFHAYNLDEQGISMVKINRINAMIFAIEREIFSLMTSLPIIFTMLCTGKIKIAHAVLSGIVIYFWADLILVRMRAFQIEDAAGKSVMSMLLNSATHSLGHINKEFRAYVSFINQKQIYTIFTYLIFVGYAILSHPIGSPMFCTIILFGKNIITTSVAVITVFYAIESFEHDGEKCAIPELSNLEVHDAVLCNNTHVPKIDLTPGAALCVFGLNGVGKTLLCRAIMGYDKLLHGSIARPVNSVLVSRYNTVSDEHLAAVSEYSSVLSTKPFSTGMTGFIMTIWALKNHDCIVIDEALDSLSDNLLQIIMSKINNAKEKIIVLVSHRKDIIRQFENCIELSRVIIEEDVSLFNKNVDMYKEMTNLGYD